MSGLHTSLGAIAIGLNALAAVIGGLAWLARRNPRVFWLALRAGQALIMVEAVIGAVLLLDGKDLPRLHLVYGLTPIAVAFLAEQLKLLAPTNIAFGGPDLSTLIIAGLCGWSVHTAPMPVAGLPVRYPKL